jgi:hypothetical protein
VLLDYFFREIRARKEDKQMKVLFEIKSEELNDYGLFYSKLISKNIPFDTKGDQDFSVEQKYSPEVFNISKELKIPVGYLSTYKEDSTGLIFFGIAVFVLIKAFGTLKKRKR